MAMKDPVTNVPTNQWYEKRNHVQIPPSAESKGFLDAFYTGEGSTAPGAPVNTDPPTLVGTPTVGQVLSCDAGTWTGDQPIDETFQWYANGVAIPAATENNYTLVAGDTAKMIYCRVTATNSVGAVGHDSDTLGPVAGKPINTGLPVVIGTPLVGQVLTSSAGQWQAHPAVTVVYQWQRAGVNIAGALSNTYTLVQADGAQNIRCVAVATNAEGSTSATSAAVGPINMKPVNSSLPVVSGIATVGETLHCNGGGWLGYPGVTLAYQWRANGQDIAGAQSADFVLTRNQLSFDVRCGVTASNAYGDTYALSASTTNFVTGAPMYINEPTISGDPTVGSTLTCDPGTWSGYPAPTFEYFWYQHDGAGNYVEIVGANASTYVVQPADAGWYLMCTVIATNSAGDGGGDAPDIGPIAGDGPVVVVAPYMEQPPLVGEYVLTEDGTYSSGSNTTLTYQWQRGGVAIAGATFSTYLCVEADYGTVLSRVETPTSGGLQGEPQTAAAPAVCGKVFTEDWSRYAPGDLWAVLDVLYTRSGTTIGASIVAPDPVVDQAPTLNAARVTISTSNSRSITRDDIMTWGLDHLAELVRYQDLNCFTHIGDNSARYGFKVRRQDGGAVCGVAIIGENVWLQNNTQDENSAGGTAIGVVVPGTTYFIRQETEGDVVKAKFWEMGSAEPPDWITSLCTIPIEARSNALAVRYATTGGNMFDSIYFSAAFNADAPYWPGYNPPAASSNDPQTFSPPAPGNTFTFFDGAVSVVVSGG